MSIPHLIRQIHALPYNDMPMFPMQLDQIITMHVLNKR